MNDHEIVILINIIFNHPYSFKIKLSQLPYLDSEYEDIIEKIYILWLTNQSQLWNKGCDLHSLH